MSSVSYVLELYQLTSDSVVIGIVGIRIAGNGMGGIGWQRYWMAEVLDGRDLKYTPTQQALGMFAIL